jgi:N-acylneuraminate cytidylyltransferase
MNIIIIPLRSGSEGIIGKNLKKVNNFSLAERAIRTSLRTKTNIIIVSTNDLAVKSLLKKYPQVLLHERSETNAQSTSSTESLILEVIQDLGKNWRDDSVLGFMQATSPFLSPSAINECLDLSNEGYSAFTAKKFHSLVWQLNSNWNPVNHPVNRRPRRQEMDNFVIETGGFYSFPLKDFMEKEYRFCTEVKPVLVEDIHSIEIDDEYELKLSNLIATQFELTHFEDFSNITFPKIIFTDFDGCLTNDKVKVNFLGKESVVANRKDGLAVKRLKKLGIEVVIITMEKNNVVQKRADKMKIEALRGVEDKDQCISSYLANKALTWADIWYVGNDVNDSEAMEKAALSFCPIDASPEIFKASDVVLSRRGGEGLLAEIAYRLENKQ